MIDFILGTLFWMSIFAVMVVGGAFAISALVMWMADKRRKNSHD